MSRASIKKLIGSVSPNALDYILKYALSWYLGDKQQLWGATAQSALHAVTNRQQGFESESVVPLWKEAYYSLVMLEKMIHQFDDLCFAKDLEDIWEAICEMLLHPHS
ncbi:ARM repeat superfamily protein [Trifolium repens]|nr:ARM repeat superfamily protein [Trifolium repens]